MPTIIGSKSGTRPFLELDWSVTSQDIANNRSRVNLKLYLRVTHSIGYSARYTGTLYGASFTSSSGYISSPGRYLLTERNVWINHNSDGTRTERLTADYNLNITWSGVYHGKISLSGNANLGTIPRASTLSAFSFGAHLKDGVANTIKYTVDRKSGNFRHQIQLRDGNTTIWTWDNQNTDGSNSIALTASNVNTLLNRIKTSTTKSFTLRVATRSGNNGGWIGSAVSRNATATVHADVRPTVGSMTLTQTGNPVSTHALQGFSKIKAYFSRSAGYGATISSSSIQVRRRSGGRDSQTINSNDGTTTNPVSSHGVYEARGQARDSRGRVTNTAWATITVTEYVAPAITNFSVARNSSRQTTVNISRTTTHTVLGTGNHLTYTIQRRQGTGAWTNVNSGATGTVTTSGATGSATSTGNSVTQSYEFRLVVTDKLGGRAEALQSVTTQRVVLDVHKNEGVGIGKIHERGVLDVNGTIYTDGEIHLQNSNFPENEVALVSHTLTGGNPGIEITSNKNPHGYAYIDFNTTRATDVDGGGDSRILASHGDPQVDGDGILRMESGDIRLNASRGVELDGRIDLNGSVFVNGDGIARYYSNSLGHYIRFYNGIQICWNNTTRDSGIGYNRNNKLYSSNNLSVSYPSAFIELPAVTVTGNVGGLHASVATANISNNVDYFGLRFIGEDYSTSVGRYNYIAIGRWK